MFASVPGADAHILGDSSSFTADQSTMYIASGTFTLQAILVNAFSLLNVLSPFTAGHAYFIVMAITGTTNPVSAIFML